MTAFQPEILIQSPQGKPIAVVEVRNRQHFSLDIAREYRRNLLRHGLYPHGPYFLLASQDKGYLWTDAKENVIEAEPSYEFPMENVVARYMKTFPGERLYGSVFELVVLQWLYDLSAGTSTSLEEPEKTLERAGFSRLIKGANVNS
ncbi:MAG: hypothetical protein WCD86_26305 [Ktedonobacteraceae bacterium]